MNVNCNEHQGYLRDLVKEIVDDGNDDGDGDGVEPDNDDGNN